MAKNADAGLKFLQADFDRCFEQARHYDSQSVDIFKFLATFFTVIAGGGIGLFEFAVEKHVDLTLAIVAGFLIALCFGLGLFGLVVRNRVYFVGCMRYLNEQRRLFLDMKPLGFRNQSGMYTDAAYPRYFNWLSSQSFLMYAIAALNAALLSLVLALLGQGGFLAAGLLLLAAQVAGAVLYLRAQERRTGR
ncbi:MAG: hypothetical protein AB1439_01390 [candidate division FCPU426 bacterium]